MSTISTIQEIQEVIISRRTIHKFKPDAPPREVLYEAIDLARWAPNHKLTEPWTFYILGKTTISRIAHLNADRLVEKKGQAAADKKRARWLSMPAAIAVSFKKCGDDFREKEDYAATCCAAQNMMLFLWSKGIGMKWSTSGVITDPAFHEIIGADPACDEVIGLFWCGYPEDIPQKDRIPSDQLIKELP
ncbi:MAG: nitroreductase [Rhodothermaceae bacterium]|nr:nitroreductase [Rhodothermaceae bacterium]